MSRLIDADALKKVIYFETNHLGIDFHKSKLIGIAIDNAPTIEAEPIRHGKLLRTEAYPHRLYCSECFMTLIPNEEICFEKNKFPKYCMWCGAKLDMEDTP